jgi:methylated-DNA-[protein]-cysteine S-methyltransferase
MFVRAGKGLKARRPKTARSLGAAAYIGHMTQYALFETPLGWCGIGWRDAGLVAVRLPEPDREAVRRSLLKRLPGAQEAPPPPWAAKVVADIEALMAGDKPDFAEAPLDASGVPDFHARVYEIARSIPPGKTLTYGEVASRLGDKGLARAVGQALGRNPWPIVIPCHRVTAAGGKLGGFTAPGGAETKLRLLEIEGAEAAVPRLL